MSNDLLKKLAIGVGALVLLWIGSELLRGSPPDGGTPLDVPELDIAAVDSIVIGRPAGAVRLVRRDDGWLVNGRPAGYAGVSDLVTALGETLDLQLVGRNPEMHDRYEITDGAARRLTVYRGDGTPVDLLFGKRGSDFQSVYVRHPGEDAVYAVRSRLGSLADRPLDEWRDKVIAAIEPDAVHGIEVRRGGDRYALARSDSVWTIDGTEADATSVNRLLGHFRALNAAGFPTEAQLDSVDLAQPDRLITLLDSSATAMLELAFDSSLVGYWVRANGGETIYRLDRYRVDQLTPADSTLRSN